MLMSYVTSSNSLSLRIGSTSSWTSPVVAFITSPSARSSAEAKSDDTTGAEDAMMMEQGKLGGDCVVQPKGLSKNLPTHPETVLQSTLKEILKQLPRNPSPRASQSCWKSRQERLPET